MGVMDDNGQQWERCNQCGNFEEIEELRYEQPSTEHEYGRDLCRQCAPIGQQPAKPITIIIK